MSDNRALDVVICWHMHQPMYANRLSGEYCLPWTYLHAIKDYVDMAAHLESVSDARAVVNFAPILLEQIDDYSKQIDAYFNTGTHIRDPLLSALGTAVLPVDVSDRVKLVQECLRANKERLIDRFTNFKQLAEMAAWFTKHQDANIYINDQFIVDLLVWYHLAWLGETVRRNDPRVKELIDKAGGYTLRDRRVLLEVIGNIVSGIIDRYRQLAENGQVELSTSPYAHPIVPLMLDFNSAKQAMPDVSLPLVPSYPGGEQRARWHIQKGIDVFEQFFGFKPVGCWPSEGSISDASIRLFEEAGFRWLASGESVINNSIPKESRPDGVQDNPVHCTAYSLNESELACFFRDDGLSDMVGFTYSTWHADDAVANLVHNLENMADSLLGDGVDHVVSIILDGENAWEYYPKNGFYFLSALYSRLAESEKIRLTTFAECMKSGLKLQSIDHIVAGSWVYGTFSTWIGDADKNRAWDMLAEAKRAFDDAVSSDRLSVEQLQSAELQLAICEGSDWFWWFGDYNPADTVSDFEHLFRLQLVNLYQIIGEEPPEYLSHVFAHGSGLPQLGGVMRRGSQG